METAESARQGSVPICYRHLLCARRLVCLFSPLENLPLSYLKPTFFLISLILKVSTAFKSSAQKSRASSVDRHSVFLGWCSSHLARVREQLATIHRCPRYSGSARGKSIFFHRDPTIH